MNRQKQGSLVPTIHSFTYWSQREQFFKESDLCVSWTLLAVESGSFQYQFDDHEGIAEMGDLVICAPGTVFRRKVKRTLSFYFVIFTWHVLSDHEQLRLQPMPDEHLRQLIPTGKISIKDVQRLSSNYDYLRNIYKKNDEISMYRKNLLLQDIWQLYCHEAENSLLMTNRIHDPLMEKAVNQLQHYASEPFNMKKLSSELGLTAVQFTRRFRAFTGMTPTDYLSAYRLDKARNLLKGTHFTIDEIATQCGYDNGHYFSRVFYKKMKIRPSQYRQDHQI